MDKSGIFIIVVEKHKGILYKVANLYCKEQEGRKDLIQEILVQLWKSFDSYNEKYKYSTWIYRIALNTAISAFRKSKTQKLTTHFLEDQGIVYLEETNMLNPENEKINYLYQFISELKDLDKALILLYLEENSYKEIAEIMGLTETNIATKIGRIKILLKEKFSKLNIN